MKLSPEVSAAAGRGGAILRNQQRIRVDINAARARFEDIEMQIAEALRQAGELEAAGQGTGKASLQKTRSLQDERELLNAKISALEAKLSAGADAARKAHEQ